MAAVVVLSSACDGSSGVFGDHDTAPDGTADSATDSVAADTLAEDVWTAPSDVAIPPIEFPKLNYGELDGWTPAQAERAYCKVDSACPVGQHCNPDTKECEPFCDEGSGYNHVLVEWRPEGSDDPSLNFFSPIDLQFAPDGRGFLLQKDGTVWILKGGQLLEEPFVRVPDTSDAWIENGLLGIAIDPEFSTSPYIYLFQTYVTEPGAAAVRGTCPPEEGGKLDCPFDTVPNPEEPGTTTVVNKAEGPQPFGNSRQRVIRYRAFDDVAESPDAFEVLLDDLPGGVSTHNGGGLVFGHDGYLFVGLGDSVVDTAAADPGNYPGTVLRIDKETGAAAPDNPYIGDGDGKLDRMWAWGIRQGFNLIIHPDSGELYQAENGPTSDEFNWIARGANLGWNHGVGPLNMPDHLDPLLYWPTVVAPTKSIIYSGDLFPELKGVALVGTWADKGILRIDFPDPIGNPGAAVTDTEFYNPGGIKPVLIAQDPQGHIYYSSALEGKLFRIDRAGGCIPPRALITASVEAGPSPLEVVFDGTLSTVEAPATKVSHYAWTFDDGSTAEGPSVTRTFTATRPHVVSLTIRDNAGLTNTVSKTVYATAGEGDSFPSSHIVFAGPLSGPAPHKVELVGHGHDAEGPISLLEWEFGDGSEPVAYLNVSDSTEVTLDHTYSEPGTYTIRLTAYDSVGQFVWTTVVVTVTE